MPTEYFLLDTNIYRHLAKDLSGNEIAEKALAMAKAEQKKGFGALCSIIVASELIYHLLDTDPEQSDCYNALFLLRYHTSHPNGHTERVIAYPMENVLTNFFRDRDYKHFNSYNGIIRLMEYLTEQYSIQSCKLYEPYIKEVLKRQNEFRQTVVKQADDFLQESGWRWDSFITKNLRKNHEVKLVNEKRLEEYKRGDSFYRLAKILIDRTYGNTLYSLLCRPSKEKLKTYLERFQAPLRMYHFLIKKIGEALGMQTFEDTRWNTINDMNLLFSMCDPNFENVLLVTEDDDIFGCVVTTQGWENKVGKLAQYHELLGD